MISDVPNLPKLECKMKLMIRKITSPNIINVYILHANQKLNTIRNIITNDVTVTFEIDDGLSRLGLNRKFQLSN